jgi:hypothetical protein
MAMPGAARATCYSSTPARAAFTDPVGDAGSSAPDLRRIDVTLDASCVLTVVPVVDAPSIATLFTEVGTFIDVDGDPGTGYSALGLDAHVSRYDFGTPEAPTLDWCDSAACPPPGFGEPLTPSGTTGFTAPLDRLEVFEPTTLGFVFESGGYAVGADSDSAPGSGTTFDFPVSFSTTPPPPPAPPPKPAGGTTAPPPVPVTPAAKKCKVPKIRGLRVAKAKKKLVAASCRYKVKGKGRVVSTSPAAGTETNATVKVRAKKSMKARKRR